MRLRRYEGFLGCRITKMIEAEIKKICLPHKRSLSEALNYLWRIFLEDKNFIGSAYLK